MKAWLSLIGGFLLGFLTAVVTNLAAPDLLASYTGQFFPIDQMESVGGTVVKKQRESARLLLTLSTSKGVLLATFTKNIDEIDLLIAEGYAATIKLRGYAPFVENPLVERVEVGGKE
ncbi:MAG: hypothetical protein OEV27_10655 [Nitrospira sp.]|nr:hypothetical protein [Nitrospira sp.]MDH4251638.1 hypothetical protein [Nitrospira sp.]MDH4341920.1 hypothetical protein [Nitrospira sp.]MDH5337002.1 hypothetical protein [Nitrospira sp.]